MPPDSPPLELSIITGDRNASTRLTFIENQLSIFLPYKPRASFKASAREVVWADLDQDSSLLTLHLLTRKTKKHSLSLVTIEGKVSDPSTQMDAARLWVDKLMDAAYDGVKRQRRLRILINPFGGPGKARTIFTTTVEPIFRAAHCSLDVTYTTHRHHAQELAQILPLDFDVVVALSGDGLVHELVNGFAAHSHPIQALDIPIVPIPTGSGNALSLNILGLEDGFDVAAAALNAIKGKSMKLDICSITQGGKRSYSFLSQTVGIIADIDLKTEHLRWLGDGRFKYGYLRSVLFLKTCPVHISIKVAHDDKHDMVNTYRSALRKSKAQCNASDASASPDPSIVDILPTLTYRTDEEDGWVTFNQPVMGVCGGKGPFIGRDLMQFPLSLPDDGLLDLCVQELTSRGELLKTAEGAERGSVFWREHIRYYKAHAYRVKPYSSDGCLSVDGEHYPFEEFQVEVHRGLATVLSPYGQYAANFELESPSRS